MDDESTELSHLPPTLKDVRSIIHGECMPFQLVPNKDRDDYFATVGMNPSSLASGLVGVSDVNPTAVKLAWESPDSVARSAAAMDSMDRGTLAHLLVLQPELLWERVAIWEGGKRIGKEYDQFCDTNADKLILRSRDYAAVAKATNAMRSIPAVSQLVYGLDVEVAMFGSESCRFMDGHMLVKGQVDGVNHAAHTIVDLKTTEAGIDQRSVERTIRHFRYREKMAMYRRWLSRATGTDAEIWKCYNVFMSLTPPYGVLVVKFVNGALEWGEERMLVALNAVETCLASNEWPMYCREVFMAVEPWELDDDDGDIDYDQ